MAETPTASLLPVVQDQGLSVHAADALQMWLQNCSCLVFYNVAIQTANQDYWSVGGTLFAIVQNHNPGEWQTMHSSTTGVTGKL